MREEEVEGIRWSAATRGEGCISRNSPRSDLFFPRECPSRGSSKLFRDDGRLLISIRNHRQRPTPATLRFRFALLCIFYLSVTRPPPFPFRRVARGAPVVSGSTRSALHGIESSPQPGPRLSRREIVVLVPGYYLVGGTLESFLMGWLASSYLPGQSGSVDRNAGPDLQDSSLLTPTSYSTHSRPAVRLCPRRRDPPRRYGYSLALETPGERGAQVAGGASSSPGIR